MATAERRISCCLWWAVCDSIGSALSVTGSDSFGLEVDVDIDVPRRDFILCSWFLLPIDCYLRKYLIGREVIVVFHGVFILVSG